MSANYFNFFLEVIQMGLFMTRMVELEYSDKTDFAEFLENYFIEGSSTVFTNENINYELFAVYNFNE